MTLRIPAAAARSRPKICVPCQAALLTALLLCACADEMPVECGPDEVTDDIIERAAQAAEIESEERARAAAHSRVTCIDGAASRAAISYLRSHDALVACLSAAVDVLKAYGDRDALQLIADSVTALKSARGKS